MWPLTGLGWKTEEGGWIPARGFTSGEGEVDREQEGAMAHQMEGLGGRIGGRETLVGDGTEVAA